MYKGQDNWTELSSKLVADVAMITAFMKKNKFGSLLHTMQINSNCIIDLNVRVEATKLL